MRAASWPLGITVILVVLLIMFRLIFPGMIVALATPFWKIGTFLSSGVGNAFAGFASSSKLTQENAALAGEIASLQNQNAVLTTRAQDLTKILGGQNETGTTILAGVVARPPVSAYDTLIVASGSKDGVLVNAEVYGSGGIPLGIVKVVTAHTATIELFSKSGLATDAWVGQARVPATLQGVGAGTFTVTLAKNATPTVGDSVYVSGPGALPIGTIARIESNPSSPTVVLDIQPLANPFSITWVEISR
jgi:cell shape-determining protein MreC